MKKNILITALSLFIGTQLFSQAFELIQTPITNLGESSSAWGDYDNDGDLDILIMGTDNFNAYTQIYRNDQGVFTDIEAGLPGVEKGDVEWIDYDLDGDLDIMLLGRSSEGAITDIYVNNNGQFTPANIGVQTVIEGCAAWSDYDLDGDLDVLISGDKSSYNPFTMLYQNNNGIFEPTEIELEPAKNTIAAWGDFDNDGDEDLFLAGNGNIMFSRIYRNDKGNFTDMMFDMPSQFAGGADWGDFDNDGDLDLLVNGFDEYLEEMTLLYANASGQDMKIVPAYPDKSATGNAEWGDFDNDGDLDMLYCGKGAGCGLIFSKVLRNDDGLYFNDAGVGLLPTQRSHAAWGDYDNDNDLDILLCGFDAGNEGFTGLYQNPLYTPAGKDNNNILPTELNAEVNGQDVFLSWKGQIPMTYNLRMGTSPGAADIVNPYADAETGFRYIQKKGNISVDTAWTIKNLSPGTYYWSVQSVNHIFAGSEFAEEQSFTIQLTSTKELIPENFSCLPNPAKSFMTISLPGYFEAGLFNTNGQKMLQSEGENQINLQTKSLSAGIYFLRIKSNEKVFTQKIIVSGE